jgi:hypothetical protein
MNRTYSEGMAMAQTMAGVPDVTGPGTEAGHATWRKSRHSVGNGCCVETARLSGHMAVRDSKDASGPALLFSDRAWNAFVSEIKAGVIPTL